MNIPMSIPISVSMSIPMSIPISVSMNIPMSINECTNISSNECTNSVPMSINESMCNIMWWYSFFSRALIYTYYHDLIIIYKISKRLPGTLGSSWYVKHANNGRNTPRHERDTTRTGCKASCSTVWWLNLSW